MIFMPHEAKNLSGTLVAHRLIAEKFLELKVHSTFGQSASLDSATTILHVVKNET